MFHNLRTSTKIAVGLTVLLVNMAVLGGLAYVMFAWIASETNAMKDHSFVVLRQSTGVERAAFQMTLDQKDFLLDARDEVKQQIKKHVEELRESLKAIDQIADRFRDAALVQECKDIRDCAAKYEDRHQECLRATDGQTAALKIGVDKGNIILDEADIYVGTKKTEFSETRESVVKVSRIESLTWQMHLARQKAKFLMSEEWFNTMTKHLAEAMRLFAELERMHPDAAEQKQIAEARKTMQRTYDAGRRHYEEQKRDRTSTALEGLDKEGDAAAADLKKACEDYLASKLDKEKKMTRSIFLAADLGKTVPVIRLSMRIYMQSKTKSDAEWQGVIRHVTAMKNLCGELRKVVITDNDLQRIDRVEKAVEAYADSITAWKDNELVLRQAILTMKKASDAILTTTHSFETDAWKATEKATDTVIDMVASSKIAVVASLVGSILAMIVIGHFISRGITRVLTELVNQGRQLTKAAVEGSLRTRGNPELVTPEFRPIVEGINATLDAIVAPLSMAASYVDRISKGDIPPRITDDYRGDFNEIKNNLNRCIDSIRGVIEGMRKMHEGQVAGDIDAYVDVTRYAGAYRQMAEGVNASVKLHVDNIVMILHILGSYADGDLSQILKRLPGKQVLANEKMDLLRSTLLDVVHDVDTLAKAATAGKLDARVDADRHHGAYREILQGLNATLEGFVRPIDDIGETLGKMAAKDFSGQITAEYPGTYGELRDHVNLVVTNMREAITQISENASQFAEGARVIAESAQTLSHGAQAQSASVEQINSSIEEFARSVQMVKENAAEADKVAKEASGLAELGGQAVQKSTDSMAEIRESSQQISEIIQVISEIASQTNLLALNAAIEAARAGEHGMGFAVVADEVRKLAERSNQAAHEISTLIKESTKRVEEGVQLSDQTGNSLRQIIQAVEKTAARISEIATATIQQAGSAEEVAKAIQGVAQVTEQNAAGSEQMASSSEELGAQATSLRELVAEFRINAR